MPGIRLMLALSPFILEILPYLVFGFRRNLIEPFFSIPDAIDILIVPAFFAYLFYLSYHTWFIKSSKLLRRVYFISVCLFFE